MLLHRHYPKLSAAGLAGVDLGAILSGEIESEIMNVDAMVECSPDPGSTPGTSTNKLMFGQAVSQKLPAHLSKGEMK